MIVNCVGLPRTYQSSLECLIQSLTTKTPSTVQTPNQQYVFTTLKTFWDKLNRPPHFFNKHDGPFKRWVHSQAHYKSWAYRLAVVNSKLLLKVEKYGFHCYILNFLPDLINFIRLEDTVARKPAKMQMDKINRLKKNPQRGG